MVSGEQSYVRGASVWTDYAYDDRGASASPGGGGAAAYPASASNAADLIQLQLIRTRGGTQVKAILETILDPSVPSLGVGFDLDGKTTTGAACVPGGYWKCKGRLGLDRLLVLDKSGARLLNWTGRAWKSDGRPLPATINPADNTMTTMIPGAHMPVLGSAPWRVVGVLGLRTSSWLTGGPIYDLAYVGKEVTTTWQNSRQADVLSGNRPASEAVGTVVPELVRTRADRLPRIGPGYHVFLYHSPLALSEGIRPSSPENGQFSPGNYYLGPYQPYQVWLPAQKLRAPSPLVVFLHGAGQSHLLNLFGKAPVDTLSTQVYGGTTFDVPAVVVTPLARGEGSYYWGIAEQDVLDAIEDVKARLAIDQDRVVLAGASMGGLGTWRLSQLYPDAFSGVVPMIAPVLFATEHTPVGPQRHVLATSLENLANLPIRMIDGRLDPLPLAVSQNGQDTDFTQLVLLGSDVKYWQFLKRTHELSPVTQNCVLLDMLSRRRNPNPARVVYTIEPGLAMSDPTTGLKLDYTGAYWVQGMSARVLTSNPQDDQAGVRTDPNATATVEAVSFGRGAPTTTSALQAPAFGQNITTAADACNTPRASARTDDSWYLLDNRVTTKVGPASNALEISLRNVARVSFDLGRASIATTKPVQLTITGDGRTTVTLIGHWRGRVKVSRDGAPFATIRPSADRLVFSADVSGRQTFVLTAA